MTGLFERSFLAAAVIAALILFRALLLHRLPKFTFQAAWAVVILRLLLPYSVPVFSATVPGGISQTISFLSVNSNGAEEGKTLPTESDKETVKKDVVDRDKNYGQNQVKDGDGQKDNGSRAEQEIPSGNMVFFKDGKRGIFIARIIWFVGVIAGSAYFLLSHLRARLLYLEALPVEYPLPELNRTLRRTMISRRVKVKVSDQLFAPVTCGIISPVIILPKSTEWENVRQLRMVLEHEVVHIRRLDVLYKWLLAAAVVLHWFNPLVLAMYFLANRDIELSCDEAVIRRFEDGKKKDYALALLNYEEKRMFSPTVTGFGGNAVKERMKAIMKLNKTTVFGVAMSVILVAGTTTVFAGAKENKNAQQLPKETKQGAQHNTVPNGGDTTKKYICEPAYYTLEELEEAMEIEREKILQQLKEGILDRADADRMLQEIEDSIRDVKNGRQVEKPSPVYNADGTPLVNSRGEQLCAKASDIEQINKELREHAENMDGSDAVATVEDEDIVVEKKFITGYEQTGLPDNFVLPETDKTWYSYEQYQEYAKKQKEEYRSMLGDWGYNLTEGWFEWDEKRIEEACRHLDENLEFIKNGGMISMPDSDGTVFMTSFSKSDHGDISQDSRVMTLEEAKGEYITDQKGEGVENGKFDGAFLKAYKAFGITADENSYLYQGKKIAGFWDNGVVMTDGLSVEDNGIYLKGVRENGKLTGFEEITREEFCELTGLAVK